MERMPQSKARLIVNVMEHGTIVGTDDPVSLEFEDCVDAVNGLVGWLASTLAQVNDESEEAIGSAMLIDALHHWTFDERLDEEGEPDDPLDEPGDLLDESDDLLDDSHDLLEDE